MPVFQLSKSCFKDTKNKSKTNLVGYKKQVQWSQDLGSRIFKQGVGCFHSRPFCSSKRIILVTDKSTSPSAGTAVLKQFFLMSTTFSPSSKQISGKVTASRKYTQKRYYLLPASSNTSSCSCYGNSWPDPFKRLHHSKWNLDLCNNNVIQY